MANDSIFALDLGTTKFCLAGLSFDKKKKPSLAFVTLPARGMHRGMLCDFREASQCIKELLLLAQKKFLTPIEKVSVGIAGSHLHSFFLNSSLKLGPDPIQHKTLNHLEQMARATYQEKHRELLHVSNIHYDLDQRGSLENPLNLSGHELKGHYFAIDSDEFYLNDIVSAINQAGLEVVNLYAEPYASASVTLTEEEKNLGIALCDIGGGTTDGIVYLGGKPQKFFTLNIAGIMMTRDLAIGLNLSLEEAEIVKNFYGLSGHKTKHELKTPEGNLITANGQTAQTILSHRIMEWSELLLNELRPFKGKLGSGILLTGGGSQVLSLTDFLKHIFKIPVHSINPCLRSYNPEETFASRFATVLGILHLELENRRREAAHQEKEWYSPFIKGFTQWIRELS